jgi:diguanylate cyclase (GGDEF)-like protein/PAS domain S-box-containing protein
MSDKKATDKNGAHGFRRLTSALRARAAWLEANSPAAFFIYRHWPDGSGRFVFASQRFADLLGLRPESLIAEPAAAWGAVAAEDIYAVRRAIEGAVSDLTAFKSEFRLRAAGRQDRWVEAMALPERPEKDGSLSWIGVLTDINDRRQRIYDLAFTDTLTGMCNRARFRQRLQQAIGDCEAGAPPFGLIVVDLDEFQDVNDSLGHAWGDELLRESARRVARLAGKVDLVARLGNDEFALLLVAGQTVEQVARAAEDVLRELNRPFDADGRQIFLGASIGIARYPADSVELDQLMVFADSARREAKRKGGNRYSFYVPGLTRTARERVAIGAALRTACTNGEFDLFYQPKVDLDDGRWLGAEALLRWHHPELGLLGPGAFVPIAEETGRIIEIGDWVLRTACRTAAGWNRHRRIPLKMAVNLSGRQFGQSDLAGRVAEILRESDCRPEWLEVEITESMMLDTDPRVRSTLETLRRLGVTIAIDDFGTGYSALSYLGQLDVDVLKIDQSFVRGAEREPRKAELIKAFISVAKALGMQTVAEGVELEAQAGLLRSLGCCVGQGYLYGRPVPAAEFEADSRFRPASASVRDERDDRWEFAGNPILP